MALLLYSIDEAIDSKFIVTRSISNQAKIGSLIHVMDTKDCVDYIKVKYRVTNTGQDFTIQFDNLKQFCKWARPDTFIARYYETLESKDVIHYIKVTNRTFTSFCLPLLIAALVIIWILAIVALGVGFGIGLSVVAAIAIFLVYKIQRSKVVMGMYSKVGTNNWGIVIK